MIILQVITLCNLGGAQSVVVNLANSLCREHEVIVAAGEGDGKMWSLLASFIKQEKIASLHRALSPINEIKTLFALKSLYRKYKPDIIHLHSSKVGILGRIVFPKSRIVYTVHGFDSIRVVYRKYLPIERVLQTRCRSIVGVSEYDGRNLLKEGITHNVCVIYNGVPIPHKLEDDPFKQMKEYTYKVLCIARLFPPKRVDLFLKVATLLPQYAFIWIGNQHAYTEEHPSNVFFMGSLPNAGAYNEYADVFMLPSDYEGLPMTIIEAMSLGKPVVASNVGGISEIVVNGENGYTVENTPEEFVEKLQYILEKPNVYNIFLRKALGFYQEILTMNKMVDSYMRIYNSISNTKY